METNQHRDDKPLCDGMKLASRLLGCCTRKQKLSRECLNSEVAVYMVKRETLRAFLVQRLRISAAISTILPASVLLLFASNWPFTREATIRSLEQASASEVRIAIFRKSFFPHPGYIAEG